MMQGQTQAPKTETLLDLSNQFYQDLLGYKPDYSESGRIVHLQAGSGS